MDYRILIPRGPITRHDQRRVQALSMSQPRKPARYDISQIKRQVLEQPEYQARIEQIVTNNKPDTFVPFVNQRNNGHLVTRPKPQIVSELTAQNFHKIYRREKHKSDREYVQQTRDPDLQSSRNNMHSASQDMSVSESTWQNWTCRDTNASKRTTGHTFYQTAKIRNNASQLTVSLPNKITSSSSAFLQNYNNRYGQSNLQLYKKLKGLEPPKVSDDSKNKQFMETLYKNYIQTVQQSQNIKRMKPLK